MSSCCNQSKITIISKTQDLTNHLFFLYWLKKWKNFHQKWFFFFLFFLSSGETPSRSLAETATERARETALAAKEKAKDLASHAQKKQFVWARLTLGRTCLYSFRKALLGQHGVRLIQPKRWADHKTPDLGSGTSLVTSDASSSEHFPSMKTVEMSAEGPACHAEMSTESVP